MHATLTDILTDVTANSIEAAAKHVSVSILEEGGVITLRVEDDGKGFWRARSIRSTPNPASTTSARSAWDCRS